MTGDAGSGRLARSPGFSDPAQAATNNLRDDVFALGRLLYHLVTGRHPADSFPLIPADRLRELPADELADLLDHCCDPDPQRRFADAGELAASLPSASSVPPARPAWRHPLSLAALGAVLLGIAVALVLSAKGPPLVPDEVEFEDNRLTAYRRDQEQVLWSREPGHIAEATLSDLDGDGVPEVLCAVAHASFEKRDGGRLIVYNADGSERWHFDTTRDFQNFSQFEDDEMACTGVLATDWDGRPGKEVLVISRNASGWFPCALHFLSGDGEWRGSYWHPGHLHQEDLCFVREKPGAPVYLAFKALNNRLGDPFNSFPPGKQKHLTTIGLLDPSVPGRHAGPPGEGKLGEQDQMTLWYRKLTPQWVDSRPPTPRTPTATAARNCSSGAPSAA